MENSFEESRGGLRSLIVLVPILLMFILLGSSRLFILMLSFFLISLLLFLYRILVRTKIIYDESKEVLQKSNMFLNMFVIRSDYYDVKDGVLIEEYIRKGMKRYSLAVYHGADVKVIYLFRNSKSHIRFREMFKDQLEIKCKEYSQPFL